MTPWASREYSDEVALEMTFQIRMKCLILFQASAISFSMASRCTQVITHEYAFPGVILVFNSLFRPLPEVSEMLSAI